MRYKKKNEGKRRREIKKGKLRIENERKRNGKKFKKNYLSTVKKILLG